MCVEGEGAGEKEKSLIKGHVWDGKMAGNGEVCGMSTRRGGKAWEGLI